MSASEEKSLRDAQRSEKQEKKRKAADEEAKKAKAFRRNTIIAIVVFVVVVAAAIIINSNLFYSGASAVKVGNTSYSAAEVDVFYRQTFNNIYSNMVNSYGEQLTSYMIDTSTPLTEQQYTEDQTWADYVYEQTLTNMQQVTALYDDAMSNGYTLTDTDRAQIDEQASAISFYAVTYGYSSVNQYLAALYGKGVTEKVYTSVMERMVVAQNYAAQVSEGLTFTQDELDSYYSEKADDLDAFSYYYYLVRTDDEAFTDLEDDARAAAAHEVAERIAEFPSGMSVETFAENVVMAANDDAGPSEQYLQGSSLSSDYKDWLLNGARKAGDTTVIDVDSGSYALLFLERDNNDYNLRSMRHILIETEVNDDNEYTEEAQAAAKAKIEEIEAEWRTDPTEEHFAELASEYSEDSGSNTTGGLYENIARHQMVSNINSFLFDETHAVGDTAVLFGESGYYQGWHLVYYAGEGDVYRNYLAENALRSLGYTEYLDGLIANYPVTEAFGARFVNK